MIRHVCTSLNGGVSFRMTSVSSFSIVPTCSQTFFIRSYSSASLDNNNVGSLSILYLLIMFLASDISEVWIFSVIETPAARNCFVRMVKSMHFVHALSLIIVATTLPFIFPVTTSKYAGGVASNSNASSLCSKWSIVILLISPLIISAGSLFSLYFVISSFASSVSVLNVFCVTIFAFVFCCTNCSASFMLKQSSQFVGTIVYRSISGGSSCTFFCDVVLYNCHDV